MVHPIGVPHHTEELRASTAIPASKPGRHHRFRWFAGARNMGRPEPVGRDHTGSDFCRNLRAKWHRPAVVGDHHRRCCHWSGHVLGRLARLMRTMGKGSSRSRRHRARPPVRQRAQRFWPQGRRGFGLSTTHVSPPAALLQFGVGRDGPRGTWSVQPRRMDVRLAPDSARSWSGRWARRVALRPRGRCDVVTLIVMLAVACWVIYLFSRRHQDQPQECHRQP